MGKVKRFQQIIFQVLEDYKGRFKQSSKEINGLIVADREAHHYQFLWLGWEEERHIFSVMVHISIIDGKIWIQHDNSEVGFANLLADKGIPKSDIVLGYFPPAHRERTDFAVA